MGRKRNKQEEAEEEGSRTDRLSESFIRTCRSLEKGQGGVRRGRRSCRVGVYGTGS